MLAAFAARRPGARCPADSGPGTRCARDARGLARTRLRAVRRRRHALHALTRLGRRMGADRRRARHVVTLVRDAARGAAENGRGLPARPVGRVAGTDKGGTRGLDVKPLTGFSGRILIDDGQRVRTAWGLQDGSVVLIDPQGRRRWRKPGAPFKRPRPGSCWPRCARSSSANAIRRRSWRPWSAWGHRAARARALRTAPGRARSTRSAPSARGLRRGRGRGAWRARSCLRGPGATARRTHDPRGGRRGARRGDAARRARGRANLLVGFGDDFDPPAGENWRPPGGSAAAARPPTQHTRATAAAAASPRLSRAAPRGRGAARARARRRRQENPARARRRPRRARARERAVGLARAAPRPALCRPSRANASEIGRRREEGGALPDRSARSASCASSLTGAGTSRAGTAGQQQPQQRQAANAAATRMPASRFSPSAPRTAPGKSTRAPSRQAASASAPITRRGHAARSQPRTSTAAWNTASRPRLRRRREA